VELEPSIDTDQPGAVFDRNLEFDISDLQEAAAGRPYRADKKPAERSSA
jgi:hypothetical protein